jgi:hypothetical protein
MILRRFFNLKYLVMAEGKKSFVAYCDWQETFEELTDEEAGKLIKHLFNYVNDKNPEASDKLTKMCFIPIKQSLKRDLKKYEGYIDKQKVNGAKGGRPKKTQITQALITEPKKADSVSVSDNVNVNISFIDKMDLFKKKVGEDDNVIWRDNVYRMHKIQKGKLFRVVEQFTIHLAIQNNGVYNENFAEFRRHCSNWIGTSIQNGKLSEFRTVKAIGSI